MAVAWGERSKYGNAIEDATPENDVPDAVADLPRAWNSRGEKVVVGHKGFLHLSELDNLSPRTGTREPWLLR